MSSNFRKQPLLRKSMAMPTKFNLSFRKYTIAELRANLESLQLLEDPHGYVRKVDDNFVHLLESNPSASANDLALILCTDGGTIVGRLGLIAGKVCFNGEFQSLYWMAGFFLDYKYRTSGAGGLLLLHALSFSRHLLAAGGPALSTRKLFDRSGYIELARLRQFVAFPSARPLLAKILGDSAATNFFATALDPIFRCWYVVCRLSLGRQQGKTIIFESVDRFPAELDLLLEAAPGNRFPKLVTDLNWVMAHMPEFNAYLVKRGNRLLGYCILSMKDLPFGRHRRFKHPMRVASLKDHYMVELEPADGISFADFCFSYAVDKNAEVLFCQFKDQVFERAFRRLGFLTYGGSYIHYRPPHGKERYETAEWHLTAGVSDMILN